MVAGACHPATDLPGDYHCYRGQLGGGTLHLHIILNYSGVHTQDRSKTILVIVTGLLVIGWIFDTPLPGQIALVVGVLCVFSPLAAKVIEWAWFRLALALGWINTRILLAVIYFFVLVPIAWLSRLFTKDPLALRRHTRDSHYATRDHVYTGKDMENIW